MKENVHPSSFGYDAVEKLDQAPMGRNCLRGPVLASKSNAGILDDPYNTLKKCLRWFPQRKPDFKKKH